LIVIAALALAAKLAFGFLDGFRPSHGTRLLPFEILRDELETSFSHRLGIARLSVHIRRPQQKESAQTVRPGNFSDKIIFKSLFENCSFY
jgi:hypothetical protein